MKDFEKLNIYKEVREFANGKTFEEIYQTCERADWLLHLWYKIMVHQTYEFFLAKAKCAELAIDLMQDDDSKKAIQAALAYGNCEELEMPLYEYETLAQKAARSAMYEEHRVLDHWEAMLPWMTDEEKVKAESDYYLAKHNREASEAAYATISMSQNPIRSATESTRALGRKLEDQKVMADIVRTYLPIHLWEV